MARTVTHSKAKRLLREIGEDLSQDEVLSRWTRAYLFLYGTEPALTPDDDPSWGVGRSSPGAVERLGLLNGMSERKQRMIRWLGPVALCVLAAGTSIHLAIAEDPATRGTTPHKQPGYSSTEKRVLSNPEQLRLLGLCPQILEEARQEQVRDENSVRAGVLSAAETVSRTNAVDCIPDASAVYVPVPKGSVPIRATSLVGDAAPIVPHPSTAPTT